MIWLSEAQMALAQLDLNRIYKKSQIALGFYFSKESFPSSFYQTRINSKNYYRKSNSDHDKLIVINQKI